MVKEKSKVQTVLESVFVNAVDKLVKADAGRLIGNLYVQMEMTSGEIQIYDDQETLLEKNIIFDWANHSENAIHSYARPLSAIRAMLAGLKMQKVFENPVFMQPLNISLVDDNFCKIETIYTIGCGDAFMEGRLMKNLEQELQNFSRKLFADIE